ncbi:hypothetical protein O3G_MSEX006730 [Manduca sexta]|uniref:Argonaute-2 n=1 Tax=Manduca sexta TaxID=7130 RepID=A0A922CLW0_MANSE|nr:hypothetical protein O3G_MSEX006730 [Manduca sexta]
MWKKRDKDKKEIEQLAKDTAPLRISDTQPSTSQASVPQPVEEESEGLGLGLSSRSRKKKQKAAPVASTSSSEVPQSVSEYPTPMDTPMAVVPAPVPQAQKETQEESEGLGLGLSKGRSRPRKKKSAAQAQQAPSATASVPVSVSAPIPSLTEPDPGQYSQIPGQTTQIPGSLAVTTGPPPQSPVSPGSAISTPVAGAPSCSWRSSSQASQSTPSPFGSDRSDTWEVKPGSSSQVGSGAGRGIGRGRGGAPPGIGRGATPPGPGWGAPPLESGRGAPPSGSGRGALPPGTGRGAPPPGSGRGAPPSGAGRGAPPSGAGRGAPPPGSGRGAPPPESGRGDTPSATPPAPRPSLRSIPLRIPGPTSPNSRRVKVLTNYLPMRIKDLKVYRYDVSFNPDKPKKFIVQAYHMAKAKLFPKQVLAFDQMKNCYCLTPLPGVTGNERVFLGVEVPDTNNRSVKYEVSFKFTGLVDLGTITQYMLNGTTLNPPTEAIQCVDVILKQGTLESYIKAGRQYFMRPRNPKDLGDGLEMWTGLFQSAIFTSLPFVNIDVAHKGFPKQQPLMQAIAADFRLDVNRPLDYQKGFGVISFLEFIKGLKVVARLIGGPDVRTREFICNGIAATPDKQEFTFTDNESNQNITMTVGDYFRLKKGYKIQYPNMNCMWVGPKDKGIYFPMELLEVAYGQARNKQLNERQLSTMVREAATPPDIRKQKIEEVIQKMNYSANPYFKHFGLEISQDFFSVESKVLEPPLLQVGMARGVTPRDGSWQAKTLLRPKTLDAWGFIAVDLNPHESNSEIVITSLMDMARQMGMNMSKPLMQQYNVRVDALQRTLSAAVDKRVGFMFIVISRRGRDTYQRVKKIAECEVGILTQCIKEVTATNRMNPQTARNILLKVNSKLMGVNQVLDQCSEPPCLKSGDVMVVGADVTHPSPDQRNIPSIAAVTASLDTKCFIYNIELSIQTPKEEMILQFEDMMFDHLVLYRKHQGKLPHKVFVFRDGVSEGQFSQVMQYELAAIHKAYARLTGGKGKPEILFLLVQKRHHTRFFLPGNQARFNVTPGTVVDTHIVHPRELDFYLVSHQAIKGTARPTRYHAVCNDGKIPDDEVEHLTFYLCHLYSRCMRSVSYPTPTYYAHLACMRARSLTYGQTFINHDLERNPMRLRVLDRMLQHSRMFFV